MIKENSIIKQMEILFHQSSEFSMKMGKVVMHALPPPIPPLTLISINTNRQNCTGWLRSVVA